MCCSAVSDVVQVITVMTNSAQAHDATVICRPNHLIAAVANQSGGYVLLNKHSAAHTLALSRFYGNME